MHSRFVPIAAVAAISFLPCSWTTDANATDWFDGQEILIECPIWEWEPSPIPNIEYELCFDDIDHCALANIGDAVCIPTLGTHDVWVTAIEYQDGEPFFYDGDIVPIVRYISADLTGDGVVGFPDLGAFVSMFGSQGGSPADLDGDGNVGFLDFEQFTRAFGKCVNESGTVYEPC